jgi:hypothetical protein
MMMDTLLDATHRLRLDGFDVDFSATARGKLRCAACGTEHDPESMRILEIVRYEGASDPADETILLALSCTGGQRGVYSAAFGHTTAEADVEALARLPHR